MLVVMESISCLFAQIAGNAPDSQVQSYLLEMLSDRKPESLRLCTLLDKPERRRKPVKVDYVGFQIPDEFVVGYGLDYAQKYRNLPYVGVVKFD